MTQPNDTETAAAVRAVYTAELERRRKRNNAAKIWAGVAVIVAASGFFIWKAHAEDISAQHNQRQVNCTMYGHDC